MSGIQLIRDYFAIDGKPPEIGELRKLSIAERAELATAIAAEWFLTSKPDGKGGTDYTR